MSTDKSFVTYLTDQALSAGPVTIKAMFGEYALYLGDKLVALVCDNRVFLKITEAGRALLTDPEQAPPYPGAKPCFVIDELLEDRDALAKILRATAAELPAPKPKKPPRNKPVPKAKD